MVTDIDSSKSCSKSNWFSGKYKFNLFDSSTEELDWRFYKSQNFVRRVIDQALKNQRGNIYLWRSNKRGGGMGGT